jgi:PAS domain S-box-containing protein
MPKKPTSKRLDKLFEGMQDEQAKPKEKPKRKATPRPTEKKPAISAAFPAATRPIPYAALPQTRALPPLENAAITQRGGSGTPSSLSLAFQMDNRNWATLQVVDETAAREWDTDEQLLVKQVVDQLSQALESARLFQETRSRAEELSVLNEMGRELTSLFSVEAIAKTIHKYASRLMDTTNLFVTLFDEIKQELTPFYVISNRERIEVPSRPLGNSLTDFVLRTRRPLFIPEDLPVRVKELGIDVVTFGNNRLAQCWMGAPLLVGDTVLGVVGVQNLDSPNIFTERHRDLLTAISSQAAIAIQNARLFEETQRRAKELDTLNLLNQKLSAQLNVDEVLHEIYEGAKQLIDAKNFYIGLYSPERNEVSFPLNISESVADKSIVTIPADKGLTGYVLRERKPVFIPENVTEVMLKLGIEVVGDPAMCWVGVPLLLGEQVIGVMAAQSYTEANAYNEHDRDLLMAVAGQAAISIQNARLFEETQRRTEELGVLNRIVSSASQMLELESMLNSVLRQTMEISGFAGGLVSLFDEEAGKLELITHHNLPQPIQNSLETNGFANTLCEYVYMNRNVLSLPDLRDGSPVNADGLIANNILSYFGVPLETKGRVIGTMCMFNHEPRVIEPRITELARSIGIQTGFAIENARLFEATQRSEADLRALFAAMQDVVMVIDKDTRYVRIAPTNPSRLYRPPTELLGQRMDEILPAETHEPFRKAIQQALEGDEAVQIEYKLDINNQEFWFLANITRLNDREVFWVARDITERKRQEQALVRRNEYLSATAEIGQLVTSTLDMPTLLSRTVNLVRDRFGFYHAGIFVTEETGFRAVLQAATGEAGAEMLRQKHNLQVGSKSIVGEVTEQGRAVVVNDTVGSQKHKFNPLLPETRAEAAIPLRVGARIIGALDIQSTTPNAFSEDDIAVLQTLADQVAIAIDNARSYELSMQAVKEMREADKLKSQFLANMSHELRTPLNSIIGFSRVILKGIDGPVTDLQQQDLLAIHNSGQHLLGLINDILDLSRIEAGKMELTFDEVNLSELITSVMSTAAGLVKDKSITLHRDLPANLPTVRADAMRIRQVLLNLLSNAAKFTDEGAITIHASVADNTKGHPEITVRVTDTGPGISQEDQKKLFQPFSQVDASPTRKSGGSGLGLSISNHLIQMHGGRIGVESEPGKGSTFYFTLPAFRGKPETAAPQNARVILAIDDDPQVISLYERYLQPQGYQVVPLSDPSRAVERVRQLKPFAVTLDIMMPGYDGWHVLNDLKSNAETRNVPVIVCSIVEEQQKGFSLGAADYLVKPILEDDLLNALDRLNDDGSLREILIVDDDPNDLRLIGQMLSGHERYHPILAEGGQKGWASIQTHTPHAVILDLFMPEMDGFALLEKMRSDDTLRDIPVIVVSGGDLTSDQQKQLQEFGKRMILKHALTKAELVAALERTLERAKK